MKLRELIGTVAWVKPTSACIATDTGLEVVTLPDPGPAEFGPLHLYLLGMLGARVWCYCRVEESGMVLEVAAQPPFGRLRTPTASGGLTDGLGGRLRPEEPCPGVSEIPAGTHRSGRPQTGGLVGVA